MIEIENLRFRYKSRPVLDGVNLKLKEGKIYGLLGENGVGKTTLMKIIAGLLKGEGKNIVDGHVPFRREPDFLEEVFYVPEHFAGGNVRIADFAAAMGEFYPQWNSGEFDRILKAFDVPPSAKFSQLSTGQQKKAVISIALALNTRLLLMDEPTNGLDIPSKSTFRSLLMNYGNPDRTVIISTHQVRDLEDIIDPVIVLEGGKVLADVSLEEIATRLKFVTDAESDPSALYCEQVFGGFLTVKLNDDAVRTRVNLEAFFNAALRNRELFKGLFDRKEENAL